MGLWWKMHPSDLKSFSAVVFSFQRAFSGVRQTERSLIRQKVNPTEFHSHPYGSCIQDTVRCDAFVLTVSQYLGEKL